MTLVQITGGMLRACSRRSAWSPCLCQRPPSRLRDLQTNNLRLPSTGDHPLGRRRREASNASWWQLHCLGRWKVSRARRAIAQI